jgi:hypothetical protein
LTAYLIAFFRTVRSLTGCQDYDLSDAITYYKDSIGVLISMGDVRVRVPVEELHPDPIRAAEIVVKKWQAMSFDEQERLMDGRC